VQFHYQNAPIKEALIDIGVELPPTTNLGHLELFHEQLKHDYPVKRRRIYIEGQFSAGPQIGASARQTEMGFAFESNDNRRVFQARLDGFSFAQLEPYENWASLRDEAGRLWSKYKDWTQPVKIRSVAVRYINQIDIPSGRIDYKDYFRTTPEVSPDLPQELAGFTMRLIFPQIAINGVLVLTQASVSPSSSNLASVVLDITVSTEDATFFSTDEELWRLLEVLRDKKNQFFEGSITEATRKLFGETIKY